jgi:hypothetical protein
LALGLLAVGMAAVSASAQTLTVSNQVFPLTQVGHSTSQAVTFTYSDDLWLNSVLIDPAYSEYALTGVSCGIGNYLPAGTPCTLTISFAPKLPGWASAPAPIGRSAPVQIGLFDSDNSATVTVSFAVTGTGTGPVAAMSPGLISDLVGSDTAVEDYVNTPYGGDGGPASAAIFYNPAAMAVDGLGNIYIADTYNDVVRVVYKGGTQLASLIALENSGTVAVVGNIYTIAGEAPTYSPTYSNNFGFDSDGLLATQSRLANPQGIAVDAAGNIYIADGSQAVRMVNATTGLLNTVAGMPLGNAGYYTGDGGPATSAQLYNPHGLAVDGYGNLYIADTQNNVIRVVYTGGTPLASLIHTESGVTATAGNIYTIAGGQGSTSSSSDGPAISTSLNQPNAVTVDSQGNVFILDAGDFAIRRVDAVSGTMSWAYWGQQINGIAVDASDNIYFGLINTCAVNQYSLLISLPYATTTVAGNGSCVASGDAGNATTAGLSGVQAMVVDGTGSLYILEPDGVRYVNASVTSLAFPNANFGVQDPQQTVSIADADIQNYPLGSTAPSTMTPLTENTGTTGLVVTAPFQVVAPTSLPAGTVDCGTLAMNLTPGQTCLAAVTVQSTTDGPVSSSATYPDNSVSFAGVPLAINLSATISGTAPTVTLTGGPLSFLGVPNTGASAAQNLTLTNLSTTTPLAINSIVASGAFAATSNCGSTLAAGSSCTISVTFTTTTTGLQSGMVTVQDDATTGSGVQTASLSGNGAYPTATLTGGPLSFTGVVQMGYGTAQTLTLANTSNVPLTIISINPNQYTVPPFKETDNCGTLLAANSSCTLSVTYAATATGLQTMTLTVTDDASSGGGTQTATLNGTGTAPLVNLSVSSIQFPLTAPGTTSAASIVTVTDTGNAPLTFCSAAVVAPSTIPVCFNGYTSAPTAAFTLSGNEADMFSVVGTTCGATLAISASCTVSVAFSPNMPGYFTTTLSVNDNSGGTGLRDYYASQNVGLVGSSFISAGRSSFTIGNATFPATAVGQGTTQTVTLQLNNSLALKSIAMQTGFTEYALGTVSGCTVDGTTVNSSTTICSIPVTFTPTAPGFRNAPLVVTTTEGGGTPYAFALTGTGTGPVAALTPGIISNYVGGSGGVCTGVAGEDGTPAPDAYVGFLNGMALDQAGNLYLSDSMNFLIWRVDPQGNIHLFAGNPFNCGGYDQYLNGNGGAALGANVEDGGPLAVDSVGGLYIGDNAANSAPSIRYINPVTKIITSVLGNLSNTGGQGNGWESNTYFYPGSIIQETVAVPNVPGPGTHNANFIYSVTQGGTSGNTGPAFPSTLGQTVVDGSVTWANEGTPSTLNTGSPSTSFSGVGCPGQTDSFGDGCTGTNATLDGVSGIALDQAGNLYFADRYVFGPIVNGTESAVYNAVVRRMDAHTGIVTIYAGNGTYGHSGDGGLATSAKIIPGDIAFDSNGNLYIDEGLQVRMVNALTGIITTVAGSGVASRYQQDVCYGNAGDGGTALSASFGGVSGIAFDAANNLYLLDATGCDVRRVDAGTQTITTIAGNYSAYAYDTGDINNPYGLSWDGSAYSASLAQPLLARVDGMGNIYVMQMSRGVRKINVSQSVMSFSGQQIDSASAPLTTTVVNAGNSGPVNFVSPFSAPPWGISSTNWTRDVTNPTGSSDCYVVGTIAIGYECPINTDFTPLVAGTLTGVTTVNDNAANNPQTITLLGTASGPPSSVTLLPFLLSFVSTVNVTTSAQNFTLSNNTTSSLPITSILLTGSGASLFAQTNNCGAALAANSSCQIAVTFTPAVLGQFIATVNVSDMISGTPATQTAGMTGLTGTPNAILTEDQLNFGQQNVGITSTAKNLTLTSTGNVPLTISSITLTGTDTGQFAISGTTCGSSLAPLAHCTIPVTFTPTSDSPTVNSVTIPFSAYVSVADNAPNTPQVSHLTGTGVGVAPTVLAIAETIHVTDAQSDTPATILNIAETIHTSDSVSIPVSKIAQAIAFTDSLPASAVYSSNLTYAISATGGGSGNAVTFGVTGPATLTGSTLTITGVGTVVVTANQAGNANYTAATAVTQSVVVNKANTATSRVSSANPAIFGQPVTFTATISPVAPSTGTPTGTVQFSVNGSAVGSPVTLSGGQATYSSSTLAIGSDSITAVYSGDSNFFGSAATALSQAVNKANTATSLVSSANPVIFGQPVTFTATISPVAPSTGTPTGTVQFSVNGSAVGSPVTLSGGQATYSSSTLAIGSDSITAVYSGDSNFIGSAATALSQAVNKATQTITFTAPTSPVTYGVSPITLVASGGASGNAVVFSVVSGPGTISGSTLTITGVGTVVVAANQAGNTNYSAATQVTQSIVVNVIGAASTPTFLPVAGTYTTAQSVTISDTTTGVTIYYTTNGTTPTTSSTVYSGAIPVTSTETLEAIATATGYSTSAVASAAYIIANPAPAISGLSPAFTNAGGAVFTLTVNGSGFIASSTVYWGASALTTTYVSATQLTAQVPAADIATAGTIAITVQSPAPGGGTSNAWQFEVDTAATGTTGPTITSTTETVTAGSTASYPVTVPTSTTSVSVTCLNLPAGAACSYSSTTNAVTITTSPTTPKGTYQIIVVFTETVTSTAFLLPILLLPLGFMRRKLAARGIWLTACLGLVLLATAALSIGCGGGSAPPPSTQQATSSGSVSLTIQ